MALGSTPIAPVPAQRVQVCLLPYVPPYDWTSILGSFRAHQVPELESADDGGYERVLSMSSGMGWFRVTHDGAKNALRLTVHNGSADDVARIAMTVRRMFDVDADLGTIGEAMKRDVQLASIWKRYPGLRVPRSWDVFESMVTTVLGQLVSVSFGRTLTRELMHAVGSKAVHPKTGAGLHLFPSAEDILAAELAGVRTSEARRIAVRSIAERVAAGTLVWEQQPSHSELRKRLLAIPGIGLWTAEYVAMHGFADDDAFPATDYGLRQELKRHPQLNVDSVRPWRAYAAMALWKSFAESKGATREPVL